MPIARPHWIAAVWGFAEATLFVFVPDVFLTWVALEKPKRAFIACGFAMLGAMLGGVLMFHWGGAAVESARTTLTALPGISTDLITATRAELTDRGTAALFTGVWLGIPYKVNAIEWGALGGGLGSFVLVSIPARILRFFLTVVIAILVRRGLLGSLSLRTCRAVHVLFWLTFYVWYFYAMRN